MTKIYRTLFASVLLAAVLFCTPGAFAQSSLNEITLAAAVAAGDKTIQVSSGTNVSVGDILFTGREAMKVTAKTGAYLDVNRGYDGVVSAHVSGATVFTGGATSAGFSTKDRVGACTSTNEAVLPVINVTNGNIFTCSGGRWAIRSGYVFLPHTACGSSVSGNSTGTNGYTTAGTSVTPVVQAQTSSTGTNTHTYVCNLSVLSRLIVGRAVLIDDVTFFYGVQTSALGTQSATLASGTMNSSTVFSYIDLPTPAASETASTVAPTRADSGTLTITPAVASANTATTTAGGFYSVKFAPASAIPTGTDLRQLLLTVTLQAAATSATVTNSPGVLVHFSTAL